MAQARTAKAKAGAARPPSLMIAATPATTATTTMSVGTVPEKKDARDEALDPAATSDIFRRRQACASAEGDNPTRVDIELQAVTE